MLILTCSDSKFSYLLKKDPAQGATIQPVRKGYVLGWYHDNHTFCMNFVDPPNQSSFGAKNEHSGDYINTQQYCTSDLLYFAIQSTLNHLLKTSKSQDSQKKHDDQDSQNSPSTSSCSLRWNPVCLGTKMKYMCNQLEAMGFQVTIQPHLSGLSDLTIANQNLSLSSFVQVLYLLSQWLLVSHDANGSVATIARIIKQQDTLTQNLLQDSCQRPNAFLQDKKTTIPYFVRKALLMRSTRNEETFNKWKSHFEVKSTTDEKASDLRCLSDEKASDLRCLSYDNLKLVYGFNNEIRKRFVLNNILRASSKKVNLHQNDRKEIISVVVDIGCGTKPVVCLDKKRHPQLMYIGVDKNEQIVNDLRKKWALETNAEPVVPNTPTTVSHSTTFLTSIEEALQLGRLEANSILERKLNNKEENDDSPPYFCVTATEMLEHVTPEKVKEVLFSIFDHQPDLILLTTPNKNFNKHYFMEEEDVRDEDHINEMTWEGFQSTILETLKEWKEKRKCSSPVLSLSLSSSSSYDVTFLPLGDVCNGDCNISGCKLVLKTQ
jgi:hypothetical protein